MKKITLLLAFFLTTMLSFGVDMAGTYTVGAGGTYSTLSAAVTDLNAATITGNVVLEIVSDITEPANIGLGVNTGSYGITIRPDADTDRTITFTKTTDNTSPSGHFVIGYTVLTAAWADANTIPTNNVTIDGYAVGGNTRRLKFTTASGSLAGSRLIMIIAACQNTTVKNCILENRSTGASPVCVGTIARKYVGAGEGAPNGVLIENNIITSVTSSTGQGIMTSSSGTLVSAATTGLVIKNNIITARARGGWFYYIDGGEIQGNELRLVQSSTAVGTINYGFWTGTGARGTFNIFNNRFIEASTFETSASGGLRVLSLGGGTPTPTYNVYNNTFAGINRLSTTTNAVNLTYLFFGGLGTIYHNTFFMPALSQAVNTGYYSSIQLSSANPSIKNNIFISNEDATPNAFYSAVSTGAIDNNVFYHRAGVTNARFVTGTAYTTLADYKAAYPTKDKFSKSVDVTFADAPAGDLHLKDASVNDVNLAAPLIASVTTDIDGNLRTALTYKGANQATDMTAVAKQFTVTVPNGTEKVYVAGSFTGKDWDIANPFQLIKTANPNEFTEILPCVTGVEYKYLCEKGDWDYQEGVFDGTNPPLMSSNRTYNAADVVPLWYRVNKITLNATPTPQVANLWVKGSWDGWATGIEMIQVTPPSAVKGTDEMEKVKSETNAVSYSVTLGGNPGDKFPANTEYKYYTNVVAPDNWEVDADGLPISNRWAIAPVMNDLIPKFGVTTDVATPAVSARILRTYEGVQIELGNEATVEIYSTSGMLIDKVRTSGTYTKDLNSGVYIIRIDGQATKFMK